MSDVRTIFASRDDSPVQATLTLSGLCELCGDEGRLGTLAEGGAVSRGIGWYRDRRPGSQTTPLLRCNDHQTCRDRFEESTGDDWPFLDSTTKSQVLLTTPAGTAYADALPSLTPEPPAAVETGSDYAFAMHPTDEWEGF